MKITLESISKATEKLAKENKELRQHLGEEEDLETLFGSEDEEEDKEIDTTPADDEADEEESKDDEDKKPNPLAALKDVALDDDAVLGDGEEEEEKDLGDEDTVIDLGSSKEDDKEPEPEEEPKEEPEVKDDEPSDEEPEVEEPEEEEPFDVEDDPEEEEPGEVLDEPEDDELADIELEPDVGDDDEDPEAAIDALELDGDEDDEVEEAGKRRGAVNPQVMDAFVDYESYLSELVGKHLEELWLNTKDEEDDFADYATKFLRGMLGYAAGKDTEVDAKVADRLVKQYLLSGGAAVDERHGEFKRNKFKKDKWNDGRKGRPRPDFKNAKPNKFDDDEVELDKVAEEDKVELSDLTADDIAAVKDMDKDAREELNDVKDGKERNEILQALGVGNAVKEDGEGNEKHTYAAYFDTSVPHPHLAYTEMEVFGNRLYVNYDGGFNADTLYVLNGSQWDYFDKEDVTQKMELRAYNDRFITTNRYGVRVFDYNNNLMLNIFSPGGSIEPLSTACDPSGNYWIGDLRRGLLKTSDGWNNMDVRPNGPASQNVFELQASGDQVWIATGGHASNWGKRYMKEGVARFEGVEGEFEGGTSAVDDENGVHAP